MVAHILSPAQRAALFDPPSDPAAIERLYTLGPDDLVEVFRRRRAANRIGYAVQLGYLRHPGRAIEPGEVPPAAMLAVLLWFSAKWVNSPAVDFEQIITTGWAKAPFFWIVPVFCVTALVHVLADLWESLTTGRGIEIAQSKGLEI